MRVFVSSPVRDLGEHRRHLIAKLKHAGHEPLVMELGTASPGDPGTLSLDLLSEADLMVLMNAWCYGTVVPDEQGGDGRISYTWLELEAAVNANLPLLVYEVDPSSAWPFGRESDDLNLEGADVAEVAQRVELLREFQGRIAELNVKRGSFTDDAVAFAENVTRAVAKYPQLRSPATVLTSDEVAQRLIGALEWVDKDSNFDSADFSALDATVSPFESSVKRVAVTSWPVRVRLCTP